MSKIHTQPEHLRRSGGKLADFGGQLADGGQKLEQAGKDLVAHASNDKSGIGSVVAKATGRGIEITGKVFSEGGRVAEGAGKRLHTTADLHEEADTTAANSLRKLHPDAHNETAALHGGGSRPGSEVGGSGGGRDRTAREHLGDDDRAHATSEENRSLTKDPVDLATGEVLLTQTDIELAGALPIVLTRTHLSSYRIGRWFGASWASTLDQRVETDADGVVFVAADGTLLAYPTPGDEPVLPSDGARWPLRREDAGFAVDKPETGESLHFAADGALTAITDRVGHRIEIGYDAAGVPAEVRHSGGHLVRVRTEHGRITGFSVADNEIVGFDYTDGRLTEVANAAGQPLRLSYDAHGRLAEWVDRNDMWYRYHYDANGRCTLAEGAGGVLTCALDYDRENQITTATDSLGNVTRYHFNAASQVMRTVDPLGGVTVTEWDRYDRLLSRTDPLGRVTRFEYTDAGDLARLTRPDGSQLVAEYNDLRQPVTVVNPDGGVWRREYDQAGNLLAVTDPTGAITRLGYDRAGHLASTTDALGATTRVESDAHGLPARFTDPLGGQVRHERDLFGRTVAITDEVGGATRLAWTAEGRLAERATPEGRTERWRYDGEGNPVEYTDPLGAVVRTEFAGFDRPVSRTDQLGQRTVVGYDTELRIVSVTNPAGLVWRYEYDAVGNLVTETDFDGRVRRHRYDAAGQLVATVDASGRTTTFTRDALGRLVERRSEDGVATFAYGAADQVVRATNQDTDVVFTRDAMGRVLAESVNGRVLRTTYDAVGRRTSRTTPSGVVSHWQYDLAGQPVALSTPTGALAFGYDSAGRETSRRFGTTSVDLTWDADHRLRTQSVSTPGAGGRRLVQRRAYTYRPDSGITTVIDQLGGVREYELDPLGRATAVAAPGQLERYGYDLNGNVTAPGQTTHDGTLLRATGHSRLEHDADGRLVARRSQTLSGQRRIWRYLWNCEDRLIGITTPDRITWRYLYDALGRRVAKLRLDPGNAVAEQTWFAWDGSTVAEQLHSSGHLTCWDYRPGTHSPLTQVEIIGPAETDRRFYAIVSDLVGTPTELVDLAGNVAWRQTTTLWGGQLAPHSQPAHCPLRFPGQYHDHESGLHYNYQRYYDPEGAIYLSADPLGLAPAPNPHGYVANPLRQFDPLGLAPYKLNVGSGQNPMPDAVNMDIAPGPGVDVVGSADSMPFRDGSFREVHAINPYGYQPVSAETARVLEPGGLLYVTGSPKNKFAMRPPPDLTSIGFEHVGTVPIIDQHKFGTQTRVDGTPISTANHRTHIYRRI